MKLNPYINEDQIKEWKLEVGFHNMITIREANEFLYMALDIGEQMLKSGAEVSRVEDSIQRICKAYGAERVDVFTITASIVVTMYSEEFGPITQTRRITGQEFDLHRLDCLNQLSREICSKHLELSEIKKKLVEVQAGKMYPFYGQILIFALISASFSLFFGGSGKDALVSAVVGIVLKCMSTGAKQLKINTFMTALLCSLTGGLLAICFVKLGVGDSASKISIGNIMLLIPGIALTNAMRDMFSGDTISGALRFTEAILLAMTIAFGFAVASLIGGGIV